MLTILRYTKCIEICKCPCIQVLDECDNDANNKCSAIFAKGGGGSVVCLLAED